MAHTASPLTQISSTRHSKRQCRDRQGAVEGVDKGLAGSNLSPTAGLQLL